MSPDTTGGDTEFNRTFKKIRDCKAKYEIAEIATTGAYEGLLEEQAFIFSIRKAPKIEIREREDYVIFRDKLYHIVGVRHVRNARERDFEALFTVEANDVKNIQIEEIKSTLETKEEVTEIPKYTGFFE
ncbi:MAG: hypothetical protein HRT49_00605 [Cognatishimia sp.]|nr:hypothetical protein [Cognatishimia sp.]